MNDLKMRKKIPTLLLMLSMTVGYGQAQITQQSEAKARDAVVYKAVFYFPKGQGRWTANNEPAKMLQLLNWAKADTTRLISIVGWADNSGNDEANKKISLFRARTIRDHLVEKGISANRVSFEGQGVDMKTSSAEARRANIYGIAVPVQPRPETKPIPEKPNPQPVETKPTPPVVEKPQRPLPVVTEPIAPVVEKAISRWYVGIELGMPFGVSNFSSFAQSKTYSAFEAGILGGYRFSPLLSAELGITFGSLRLGTDGCCSDYWMGADGERYLAPVPGMKCYSYNDIYSSVSMQQYALRLNVDVLQIVNPDWDKRWRLAFSPAIYGIRTKATIKERGSKDNIVRRDGQFQFGIGASIGGGYQLTENLGVGLRSGLARVFGKQFDGIRPSSHDNNMIWNNTLALTWRFKDNK